MSDEPDLTIIAVPVARLKDGRFFISDLDCDAQPEIRTFVKGFCWTRHEFLDGWASPVNDAVNRVAEDPTAKALENYQPRSVRRSIYWDPKERK